MTTPIYKLLPIMTVAWWALSNEISATTYDEYMTCGAGNGRYGRQYHQHSDLPCDLSKETFCITPGTQYPWSAVRRFVYENQGLMKRMYGNQRHYNVLRAELLHDLYEEMYDEMPTRQHHRFHPPSSSSSSGATSGSRTARYQKHSNANSLHTEERRKPEDESETDSFERSRAIKIVKAEPEENSRHHHGTNRDQVLSPSLSSATTTTTTTTAKSKLRSESLGNRVKATTYASEKEEATHTVKLHNEKSTTRQATRINTKRPHTTPIISLPPSDSTTTISLEGETPTTDGLLHWPPEKEKESETTTTGHGLLPLVEETQDTDDDDIWEYFEPTDFPPHPMDELDLFGDDDIWTTLEDQPLDTHSTPPTYSPDFDNTLSTVAQEMLTVTPAIASDSSELSLDNLENLDEDHLKTVSSTTSGTDILTTFSTPPVRVFDADNDDGEVHTEGYGHDTAQIAHEFEEPVAENSNPMMKGGITQDSKDTKEDKEKEEDEEEEELIVELREDVPATSGVVHKDVLEDVKKQEPSPEPVRIKRPIRGVNACPVKEEFVAPYWANNTRGETLALLNLYPFEQYIQWERCMYEHRQMYCRKGCRCEQQYRLHKLLAFDPTNECKGIFSDWFRFPSCCVCKCYDLPQDLFTPSGRRPRHRFEKAGEHKDNLEEEDDAEMYIKEPDDSNDYAVDDGNEAEDENRYDDNDDDNDVNDEIKGGAEDPESIRYRKYLVRSGGRMVNIPPQRRPRQPPRPSSHITSLRATSSPPHPPPPPPPPPTTSPTPPDSSSTLGTLDAATPYYYHNISRNARILFANAQPFPLSRIPRSNPEV